MGVGRAAAVSGGASTTLVTAVASASVWDPGGMAEES
jgi:hypothetical protein